MWAPLHSAQSFLPLLWEGCIPLGSMSAVPLLPEHVQDREVGSVKTRAVWTQDNIYLLPLNLALEGRAGDS